MRGTISEETTLSGEPTRSDEDTGNGRNVIEDFAEGAGSNVGNVVHKNALVNQRVVQRNLVKLLLEERSCERDRLRTPSKHAGVKGEKLAHCVHLGTKGQNRQRVFEVKRFLGKDAQIN